MMRDLEQLMDDGSVEFVLMIKKTSAEDREQPKQNDALFVPVDWYMAADGLRARNDTRWIKLVLHSDGSVTWEAPQMVAGESL